MIYKLVLFSWVPIPNIKVFIYFVDLNREMNLNGFRSLVLWMDLKKKTLFQVYEYKYMQAH